MKKYLFLGLCLVVFSALEYSLFHHIQSKANFFREKIILKKNKIASLERNQSHILTAYKKMIELRKKHAVEFESAKENKIENLFYVVKMARAHRLTLIKSSFNDNQKIKITLSGSLDHFSNFLQAFSKSKKLIHLERIVIDTTPSLTFEVGWEIPIFP